MLLVVPNLIGGLLDSIIGSHYILLLIVLNVCGFRQYVVPLFLSLLIYVFLVCHLSSQD